ncbi:acetyltransferase (GNAT) family protein [Kribbella rubisoli]|uniref:Acetyltransferase (GNAT) family protein n=1 Tax=Kribbella rubisoli TaxID=3075929 RepID=A0A4Q7XML7_9ACTN|nr:GNAT family N-acetyltransferase [Kribbella rubisoli]RZU24345.1 acetyltransferase (GNAT) family protein [Kribbella rubisoli]
MEIIWVDGRDPELFRRFYEVKFGVRREELEFPVGLGVEEARVLMAGTHADVRAEGIGLVEGDDWLGVAWLDWWLVGNTDTVDVELAVVPEYRRRGVASRLLDVAVERVRAEGRRIVSGTNLAGDPVTGESAGTAFARARGFEKKHAELHQVVELPIDVTALERPVDGYELVQWREHAPDEWLEQFVELLSGMSEDVPTGDRTDEPVRWTAELVRDAEARRVAQGRFTYTTAAVHTATGELAAYTQMGGTPETPERLNQYDTYVRRTHRGHGLGIAVKAPNLRAIQTGPAVMHTWNAPENAPMIAVNAKLGFRPVAQRTIWERVL